MLLIVAGISVAVLGILLIPDVNVLSLTSSTVDKFALSGDSNQTQFKLEAIDHINLGDKVYLTVESELPLNLYVLSNSVFETIPEENFMDNTARDTLTVLTENFSNSTTTLGTPSSINNFYWQNIQSINVTYAMNEPQLDASSNACYFVFENTPSSSANNVTVSWTVLKRALNPLLFIANYLCKSK